ncbi:unnamed protein product [Nyctereutes procyonoides]|uniref:(raccoon dog) hypothetical protein n=1 Tax=Nyctereutes procyonoides TaxID=34880 RepID=A0A811YMP7_NYCPR|nr:unnamed protein product [Nyctereutes procyonoides]
MPHYVCFQNLLTIILLLICIWTGLFDIFRKCAKIGEQKHFYVAVCCVVIAFGILFTQ